MARWRRSGHDNIADVENWPILTTMHSDLIQIPFEWFVTVVWERRGPLAGVLTALGLLLPIAGVAIWVVR